LATQLAAARCGESNWWRKQLPLGLTRSDENGLLRCHCPSWDRTGSRESNDATFVMSNMLPQAAVTWGVWAKLETYCRDQVRVGNELYIVAGGSGTQERIGQGKIAYKT